MGLYIPDLRLPADGDFELWIAVRKDGSFTYNVRGGWQDGEQEAVPVPPHGRLIDADALIAAHKDVCSRSMKFNLDLAPTVIEADVSEEELQREYEANVEYAQYCERYEPTYDPNTGAM